MPGRSAAGDAPVVLFACVRNAGRSQMAAALLQRVAGNRVRVASAGSEPAGALHPEVVTAMAEIGLDLSQMRPTQLTPASVAQADVVVTMGCGQTCPVFPGTRHEDWSVRDPYGLPLDDVRAVRDEISRRVIDLFRSLEVEARSGGHARGSRA